MFKLLVTNSQGYQEIVQVEKSGYYEDEKAVIWDERVDGDFPDKDMSHLGGWVRSDNALKVDSKMLEIYQEKLAAAAKLKKEASTAKEARKLEFKNVKIGSLDDAQKYIQLIVDQLNMAN